MWHFMAFREGVLWLVGNHLEIPRNLQGFCVFRILCISHKLARILYLLEIAFSGLCVHERRRESSSMGRWWRRTWRRGEPGLYFSCIYQFVDKVNTFQRCQLVKIVSSPGYHVNIVITEATLALACHVNIVNIVTIISLSVCQLVTIVNLSNLSTWPHCQPAHQGSHLGRMSPLSKLSPLSACQLVNLSTCQLVQLVNLSYSPGKSHWPGLPPACPVCSPPSTFGLFPRSTSPYRYHLSLLPKLRILHL